MDEHKDGLDRPQTIEPHPANVELAMSQLNRTCTINKSLRVADVSEAL